MFSTEYVSILILLFPDSLEFSLQDALNSGKFWIHVTKLSLPPKKKKVNLHNLTLFCRFERARKV